MDELMCWLGVNRASLQIRYFEPVKISGGTNWAQVPREFAAAVMRAWTAAIDEIEWPD